MSDERRVSHTPPVDIGDRFRLSTDSATVEAVFTGVRTGAYVERDPVQRWCAAAVGEAFSNPSRLLDYVIVAVTSRPTDYRAQPYMVGTTGSFVDELPADVELLTGASEHE
jgi:hypothetical protein